jgi:hypothetical protein
MRLTIRLVLAVLLTAVIWVVAAYQTFGAANTVDVVYFYPKDQTVNQEYVDALGPAMADIQAWYGDQVGSPFTMTDVQVIQGKSDAAQYQGDVWRSVLSELGFWCGTGINVVIVHSSISYQGGGSCDPPYEGGDRGGDAMAPETTLDGELGRCDLALWWCSLGGLAHDVGHAFSLPHPTGCGITWPDYCWETLMWSWWEYPNIGLLDIPEAPEISSLQASGWFGGPGPGPEPTCTPKYNPHGKRVGKCR